MNQNILTSIKDILASKGTSIEEEMSNEWFREVVYEKYIKSVQPLNVEELKDDINYYLDTKDLDMSTGGVLK